MKLNKNAIERQFPELVAANAGEYYRDGGNLYSDNYPPHAMTELLRSLGLTYIPIVGFGMASDTAYQLYKSLSSDPTALFYVLNNDYTVTTLRSNQVQWSEFSTGFGRDEDGYDYYTHVSEIYLTLEGALTAKRFILEQELNKVNGELRELQGSSDERS